MYPEFEFGSKCYSTTIILYFTAMSAISSAVRVTSEAILTYLNNGLTAKIYLEPD